MATPTDEQVLTAARAIRDTEPVLGRAKLLVRLKDENGWSLSEARLKKLVPPAAGAGDPTSVPPPLPQDPLAAQQRYKEDSTRCFKLYGRGKYDFGVTPNADMGILIELMHSRLVEHGPPRNEAQHIAMSTSKPMLLLWDFYCAAGRIAGISAVDLAWQMQAEYGAHPLEYILAHPPPSEAEKRAKRESFKKNSLEMKKQMLLVPEAAPYVKVDEKGEPLYDEKINGQWALIVVRINKGDGLTEYGQLEWDWNKDIPGKSILRWI